MCRELLGVHTIVELSFKTLICPTQGVSVNTFTPKKQMYPLISGSNAALPNQSSDLDLYPR